MATPIQVQSIPRSYGSGSPTQAAVMDLARILGENERMGLEREKAAASKEKAAEAKRQWDITNARAEEQAKLVNAINQKKLDEINYKEKLRSYLGEVPTAKVEEVKAVTEDDRKKMFDQLVQREKEQINKSADYSDLFGKYRSETEEVEVPMHARGWYDKKTGKVIPYPSTTATQNRLKYTPEEAHKLALEESGLSNVGEIRNLGKGVVSVPGENGKVNTVTDISKLRAGVLPEVRKAGTKESPFKTKEEQLQAQYDYIEKNLPKEYKNEAKKQARDMVKEMFPEVSASNLEALNKRIKEANLISRAEEISGKKVGSEFEAKEIIKGSYKAKKDTESPYKKIRDVIAKRDIGSSDSESITEDVVELIKKGKITAKEAEEALSTVKLDGILDRHIRVDRLLEEVGRIKDTKNKGY